jgi:hypothetical protein
MSYHDVQSLDKSEHRTDSAKAQSTVVHRWRVVCFSFDRYPKQALKDFDVVKSAIAAFALSVHGRISVAASVL